MTSTQNLAQDASRQDYGFGFEKQMREADFTQFRKWYDRTCLLSSADGIAPATSAAPERSAGMRLAA